MAERGRVAVIGAGVSGLSAAWLLSQSRQVTLYESEDRLGGHSDTFDWEGAGVDSGFIVYNERTYPNLDALFGHLGVATTPATCRSPSRWTAASSNIPAATSAACSRSRATWCSRASGRCCGTSCASFGEAPRDLAARRLAQRSATISTPAASVRAFREGLPLPHGGGDLVDAGEARSASIPAQPSSAFSTIMDCCS